jgi:hypothetical protein
MRKMKLSLARSRGLFALLAVLPVAAQVNPALWSGLKYRMIGPDG